MSASETPDRKNEEVSRWLALLERGLRGDEGAQLREWLKNKDNRKAILDAARLWHGPEVVAVLAGLIPQAELVVHKPRPGRTSTILGWTSLAVIAVVSTAAMTGVIK